MQPDRPLVSVLIPCFNAECYVGAALESVLAQSYAPIEVIVVDDGSTDGSAEEVLKFADRGVTLIEQAAGNAAASRNHALSRSNGEFVLFLDADDLIAPAHVEALVARMQGSSRIVAMGQWDRFVQAPDQARFPTRSGYRDSEGPDWLCQDWTGGEPMTQCGAFLIPRQLLDECGGWDERLTLIDDFEFFARLLSRCDGLRYAAEARLYYRSGIGGSLSGQTSRKAAESACLSLLTGTNHLLAARNDAQTRRAAANMLKTFDYTFYPAFADLRRTFDARIRVLGGSDLEPVGPPGFHALRRWIGWRLARRIQHLRDRMRRGAPTP